METAQNILLQIVQIIDPTTKDDQIFQDDESGALIDSTTNATPIVVTTQTAHGLRTGYRVHIKNHLSNTAANNTQANPNWRVTVLTATTFSLDGSVANGIGVNTGVVVAALVGAVDGDKYPRQRHLHAFNQSRIALINAITQEYKVSDRAYAISGAIVTKSDLAFAGGVATLPDGYLEAILLTALSGLKISVHPVSLMEVTRERDSAVNPIVYEDGTNFRSVHSNTFIADAATYILRYYGITDFSLDDIVIGVAEEVFNREWINNIIELAQMVIRQTSSVEVNALARELVRGKQRGTA